ncbi:MAG: bifunctional hydroxymethylpyrimidine kinase/phosphomethylpyrimidine kinase [Erythrobacter sp.]
MSKPPPRILAIAGSDSSGGAGIQADIKTITMLGGYAMTALTAATAQNSVGVQAITPLSGQFVAQQIASCINDIGVDAVKIGMLHDVAIIDQVSSALELIDSLVPIVLDPVMVATSGAPLITDDAIAAMREKLFPKASIVTPNLPELEHLAGRNLRTTQMIEEAAAELTRAYGCDVLAKGGHTEDAKIIDILVRSADVSMHFTQDRIDTRHTHGTGCTLSSAIATLLGHGQDINNSVKLAQNFVRRAIEAAPEFGLGNGPLGHQAVRNL